MSNKEKIHIYIDGGNFYHLVLKKFGVTELDFDFDKFVDFIANGRKIVEMGKRFYIGTVAEKEGDIKSRVAMSKQTSLFTKLRNNNWEIKTSKLRERLEEIIIDDRVIDYQNLFKMGIQKIQHKKLREKGIDVKLATDLIVGAIDNKYDVAIIVSSDTDLMPAIGWIRNRMKKKVEYIGFSIPDEKNPKNSTIPTVSFIKRTDIQRILVKSDLQPFISSLDS